MNSNFPFKLLLIALTFVCISTATSQIRSVGIHTYLSFDQVDADMESELFTEMRGNGFGTGLTLDYRLNNRLDLNTGLIFKGYRPAAFAFVNEQPPVGLGVQLSYINAIQVPLNLNFSINPNGEIWRYSIYGGYQLGNIVNLNTSTSTSISSTGSDTSKLLLIYTSEMNNKAIFHQVNAGFQLEFLELDPISIGIQAGYVLGFRTLSTTNVIGSFKDKNFMPVQLTSNGTYSHIGFTIKYLIISNDPLRQ